MKYRVTFSYIIEVDAENEKEAREEAIEIFEEELDKASKVGLMAEEFFDIKVEVVE